MSIDKEEKLHKIEEKERYRGYPLNKLLYLLSTYVGIIFNATEKRSSKNRYALERARRALPLALGVLREKITSKYSIYHKESSDTSLFYTRIAPVFDSSGTFGGIDILVAVPSNSATIYRANITTRGTITDKERLCSCINLEEAIAAIKGTNGKYKPPIENFKY